MVLVPLSSICESVSIILNTLVAATRPIWSVLKLSAILFKGLKRLGMYMINANTRPCVASSLMYIGKPAYHTTKPIANEDANSATGKNMELYQIVFNHAFL